MNQKVMRLKNQNVEQKARELCEAFAGDPNSKEDDFALFLQPHDYIDTSDKDYFAKCHDYVLPKIAWALQGGNSYWDPFLVNRFRNRVKRSNLSLGGITHNFSGPMNAYFSSFHLYKKDFLTINLSTLR